MFKFRPCFVVFVLFVLFYFIFLLGEGAFFFIPFFLCACFLFIPIVGLFPGLYKVL